MEYREASVLSSQLWTLEDSKNSEENYLSTLDYMHVTPETNQKPVSDVRSISYTTKGLGTFVLLT